MDKYLEWYGRGLFVSVLIAVALLGTGRLELFSSSAWSISRATFFSWLAWKLIIAIRYGRWQTNLFKRPIPFSLLVFFIVVTISLLPDFHEPGDFRYFFFGCGHAVMIMDLCENQRRAHWLYLLLALLPGVLTLRGILHDPSVLSFEQTRRFGFPLDHPNTAGYVFSMSIPLALALVRTERGPLRAVGMLSCGAQLLGLILTYSRGAWLGWAASMIFLAVAWKQWKEISIILGALLLAYTFASPLRDRLLTFTQPQADIAMNLRMQVMSDSLRLGAKNPVLGIGYGRGRLKEALRQGYQGTANENNPIWHAHNVYVELFAETGVVGLGAFLWLLGITGFTILRRAYSEEDTNRIRLLGLGGAWIAVAVTGLGDVPFYHHETRIFFFTLLALAFVSERAGDINSQTR